MMPLGRPRPESWPGYFGDTMLCTPLMRAGALALVENAERPVRMSDRDRGAGAIQAPSPIHIGTQVLRPGKTVRLLPCSESTVFHVIGGCGTLLIDGIAFAWEEHETVITAVFAGIDHANTGDAPAFPVRGHRNRVQETPGHHQERAA
jgi:hypothetical protein